MKHYPLALMCGLTCLLALPGTSKAAANFVKNGSFEINGGLGQIAPANKAGQPGFPNISLPEWTKIDERNDGSQGFAFVIDATANTAGFPSVFSPPTIKVWGPPNNTFPVGSDMTVGPDGAFWVGIDGDYGRSSLDQPITDLITGTEYELSFVWAGYSSPIKPLQPNSGGHIASMAQPFKQAQSQIPIKDLQVGSRW